MLKFQAQQICNQMNQSREVTVHTFGSANASNFWKNCSTGKNFLICGGSESQRSAMLVRMLEDHRARTGDPVIVLTGSAETEAAVIRSANDNRLGSVMVSSPSYQNYHALYGLNTDQMRKLLVSVARQKGYGDVDKMENYIDAFLAISNRYYPPSLAALVQLDNQFWENAQLQQLGKGSGLSSHQLEAISSYPAGTANLRRVLKDLVACFGNISTINCASKRNILTGVSSGMLVCIRVNSSDPQVLDLALAAELQQLMAQGRRFLLVLNDVFLSSAGGLYQQVLWAKNVSSSTHVGICVQNANAWAGTVPGEMDSANDLLKNTQNFALFNDAGDSDGDLNDILKYLGVYQKHEPIPAPHAHGPIITDWVVAGAGSCSRVAPEDLNGMGILLKGHSGRRIHLYPNIHI